MRTLTGKVTAAVSAIILLMACGVANSYAASGYVIALSNAYYGNAWRHQMADSFQAAAEEAKKDGLIGDYVILNGDNSVNQQMQQMSDLVLKHVDAIAINAASLTALNGIIEKACAAGIKVIAFDSIASAPCATTLNWDFADWQSKQVDWVAKQLGNKGNILLVRGVKGSAPDEANYQQQLKALAKYPDIKVISTVYGMATSAVAQSAIAAVLPSLPRVDAVLSQGGGEDHGIAQAFEQFGGAYKEKMPIVAGGGSADFIHWWAAERARNGYSTISMNSPPSIGAVAFWLALDMLRGEKVPKEMLMPFATVTNDSLSDYKDMKPGTIVAPTYTRAWVEQTFVEGAKP